MMTRPWIPKRRISALLLDWSIWAYISYCVFFLINHLYKSLIALSVHDRLDFPAYGWWAAIFGSLAVALIWESFGTSLGQKAQGIVLLRADRAPATALQRLRRAPTDLLGWLMTLAAVALLAAPPFAYYFFWNKNYYPEKY